jgi:hypothetical protein
MIRVATMALCAAPAIAACGPTTEELRQMPALFTTTVPDYWDRVATCLIDSYSTGGFLIPDNKPVPAEKRTELYLQIRGSLGQEFNVALYDIRGTGSSSAVTFHRRKTLINSEANINDARERVERRKQPARQ